MVANVDPRSEKEQLEAFIASVNPEDRQLVKNAVENPFDNGSLYTIDHLIVLPDGSISVCHL